jgi:hypothetical protein
LATSRLGLVGKVLTAAIGIVAALDDLATFDHASAASATYLHQIRTIHIPS